MSKEKNFMAWKRQHRRKNVAKAKVRAYEQGKIKHEDLSALAKRFLSRKLRFLTKAS